MTATQLYASALGITLKGDLECYWCGAPCLRNHPHNEPRPYIGQKKDPTVKRPANGFICESCHKFAFPNTTVQFISSGLQDRQDPKHHSWWMTEKEIRGIRGDDFQSLYELLLKPPIPFSLSLLNRKAEPLAVNKIRCMVVNDPLTILGDTELQFTINNALYHYSVYELELAIKQGPTGKEAGVRMLCELLGPYKSDSPIEAEPAKVGRPTESHQHPKNTTKKVVSKS
jgi:hypothetical protein